MTQSSQGGRRLSQLVKRGRFCARAPLQTKGNANVPDHGPDLQHDIALLEQALEMAAAGSLRPTERMALRQDLACIEGSLPALKLRLSPTRA